MKKIKIILIISMLFILTAKSAMCEEYDFTYGTETIIKDTVWSGTVFIDGVVTVFQEITLTIEPGTTVMFKKVDTNGDGFGENEIYIQGEVVAEGTKERPIIFTSAEKVKNAGDWVAINMMVSEDKKNIFKNCILEYSYNGFHAHFSTMNLIDCEIRYSLLAVQFQDSTVSIKGCNIHDNNQAIQFRDSSLDIEGTWIKDNNVGIRCVYSKVNFIDNRILGSAMKGFQVRGSDINIKDSMFENNRSGITLQDSKVSIDMSMILANMEDGISLHNSEAKITNTYIMLNGDDGIMVENSTAVINKNNIFNNAKYNINLDQEEGIDARYNFLGSDIIDMIDKFNYDKKDSDSLGEIDIRNYFARELIIDIRIWK